MFSLTETGQPVTKEDVRSLLGRIRDGQLLPEDARRFYTFAASDILRQEIEPADSERFVGLLADDARDKWLRCVAADCLKYFPHEHFTEFLKERFEKESDLDLKFALVSAICHDAHADGALYRAFIEEHREAYLRHSLEYASRAHEPWAASVLERLREQQPAARRWLQLLALDAAGYRGMMIRAHNIRKQFTTKSGTVRGIEDISLDVGKGEFVTIFGPNGCGKSTLVNIFAGLLEADSGTLASDYGSLAAIRKCYVWQNYRDALLPWRSVSENISFPLKISGVPKHQRRRQVEELMHRFGIALGPDSRVYSLSGGEQQIVSILRGLIVEPEIMLLDEPFSALDYQMNLVMEAKIMEIWAKTKITTVFVSHDLDQAILLADRIVLLSRGPSHVRQIFENPLPRPRTVDMLGHPQHVALKKQILDFFQGDVL